MLNKFARLIILQILIVLCLFCDIFYGLYLSTSRANKIIIIQHGTGIVDIAHKLAEDRVIAREYPFVLLSILSNKFAKRPLISGEYEFEAGTTGFSAWQKLTDGMRVKRRVVIPEGVTISTVKELIEREEGLIGPITEELFECNILPETYVYHYGDKADTVVRAMKESLNKVKAELAISNDDILILASIVEKETGRADEYKTVAGVYLNRLRIGMPLQADPTVIYGLNTIAGKLDRKLSKQDLRTDTPYNTYIKPGLPPGSICCPSLAAILGVLQAEKHDYLYFVADGNGGHRFAKTLQEHNKNVSTWLTQLRSK